MKRLKLVNIEGATIVLDPSDITKLKLFANTITVFTVDGTFDTFLNKDGLDNQIIEAWASDAKP